MEQGEKVFVEYVNWANKKTYDQSIILDCSAIGKAINSKLDELITHNRDKILAALLRQNVYMLRK